MIYTGEKCKEISFPLGGIGTGSIGLAGNGAFIDWEIFNRPNKGRVSGYSCFAIRAEYPDGRSVTKILQGDYQQSLMGQYQKRTFIGYGFGPERGTMCGYPHFKNVVFDGKFPIATLTFSDDNFPADVVMTAFNPFIPLNADDSSIPAAFFDIELHSKEDDVTYTVVLSVRNQFPSTLNEKVEHETYSAVMLKHAGMEKEDRDYGDMTVAVNRPNGIVQEYWYRGGWQDKVTTFWHEMTTGTMGSRTYDKPGGRDMCSVGSAMKLKAGESDSLHFVISWNIPNNYNYWSPCKDEAGKDITWKNYYATQYADSTESAFYSLNEWDMLYGKTKEFCDTLHNSTLDEVVLDAVSSTLSVLKSPTVLRLEDGSFYGWEGVHEKEGSCEGTCTHVWSYAYALCFLFPELESSIRDVEFTYDVDEYGGMEFRTKLPLGRDGERFRPCVDGQMASVFKVYREWKISGDDAWLKKNWEMTKKVLEYAWNENNPDEWDRNHDGVLEGRQHHTLDMEMFGPSSWLQGMYLVALKAAAEMASYLGDTNKAQEYQTLFDNGYQWTKENLFNGKYFIQKIDLTRKEYTDHFQCPEYWNEEKGQLKYQIAEGCEIDQILGQWHANLCGLGEIFDQEQRRLALKNMYANNFKESFRDFANMWRVFAMNDEAGTIMCDYPEGSEKPIIPIPYCEECMTGFEYAFAGLLIAEGYIEEGLQVIRAVRDRYDGEKRNPWNEIECGSNYARAMASFALLPIFSGFEYDVPNKYIGFAPLVEGDFKCLWSLGTGWGEFVRTGNEVRITVKAGYLELKSLKCVQSHKVTKLWMDGTEREFQQEDNIFRFAQSIIRKELVLL